jgi:hypothetical protein
MTVPPLRLLRLVEPLAIFRAFVQETSPGGPCNIETNGTSKLESLEVYQSYSILSVSAQDHCVGIIGLVSFMNFEAVSRVFEDRFS